jgi:creatinine amidohydrolase/Fe(II)-dependent formamide hydrolase-like protein
MDIGDMLGRQGFRFIFVVFKHGARFHNEALDQACAYFNDSYPAKKMVALTALEYNTWKDKTAILEEKEAEENGIDIHAGMDETSRMLFNRPELVNEGYKTAVPFTVRRWDDFVQVTENKNWKGYYGSPRLASKERGEIIMKRLTHNLSELAIKIIGGFDHSKLQRVSDSKPNSSDIKLDSTIKRLSEDQDRQQNEWLRKKGIKD